MGADIHGVIECRLQDKQSWERTAGHSHATWAELAAVDWDEPEFRPSPISRHKAAEVSAIRLI